MDYNNAKKRLAYLGESLNGCYGRGARELLCGSWVRPSWSGMYQPLSSYYAELVEGGVVCDKKPCFEVNEDAAFDAVISGPMLDLDIDPTHMVTTKYVVDMEYRSEPYVEGTKGIIRVGLDVYLSVWRRLGARIGKRVGNHIEWEDGSREEIEG